MERWRVGSYRRVGLVAAEPHERAQLAPALRKEVRESVTYAALGVLTLCCLTLEAFPDSRYGLLLLTGLFIWIAARYAAQVQRLLRDLRAGQVELYEQDPLCAAVDQQMFSVLDPSEAEEDDEEDEGDFPAFPGRIFPYSGYVPGPEGQIILWAPARDLASAPPGPRSLLTLAERDELRATRPLFTWTWAQSLLAGVAVAFVPVGLAPHSDFARSFTAVVAIGVTYVQGVGLRGAIVTGRSFRQDARDGRLHQDGDREVLASGRTWTYRGRPAMWRRTEVIDGVDERDLPPDFTS